VFLLIIYDDTPEIPPGKLFLGFSHTEDGRVCGSLSFFTGWDFKPLLRESKHRIGIMI